MSDSYSVLGLKPGASKDEIREAYRDLVKVWHPDRFAHDPVFQKKAQENLKQINKAYEELSNGTQNRAACERSVRVKKHPLRLLRGARGLAPQPMRRSRARKLL